MQPVTIVISLVLFFSARIEAKCSGKLILHGNKDYEIDFSRPKTFGVSMKATKVTVTGKGNSSVESWNVKIGTGRADSACKS